MSTPHPQHPSVVPPPVVAGPVRRVFHTMISIGGWALFVYWWWIVFRRVSSREIRFTALFLAVSLAVIVLVTLMWAWHNLRIFRRRGARKRMREASPDFSHDGLGRPVDYSDRGLDHQAAPVVYVRLIGDGKTYEPAARMPPRAANGGNGDRGARRGPW